MAMPSLNLRRYNRDVLEAELAGSKTYKGPPCKVDPSHVDADGTSVRDTVSRTCCKCDGLKRKRVSCIST